jgi:hypothetical protein
MFISTPVVPFLFKIPYMTELHLDTVSIQIFGGFSIATTNCKSFQSYNNFHCKHFMPGQHLIQDSSLILLWHLKLVGYESVFVIQIWKSFCHNPTIYRSCSDHSVTSFLPQSNQFLTTMLPWSWSFWPQTNLILTKIWLFLPASHYYFRFDCLNRFLWQFTS